MKFTGKNSTAFNYMYAKYKFRFNVVTSLYEFKIRSRKGWMQYDDRIKNSLLLECMRENFDIPTEKFNIFVESRKVSPDYDPFLNYFKSLPKHKKKKDYIKQVSKTLQTDRPKDFNKTLERFLVGCIDCLLNVDSVNDVCLVFQSEQGLGKSRWMRRLLPKQFRAMYFYEGAIDTRNKDHTMYLSQYWFIHLDELESLRSNDISAIKSFITRQRISVRKAYGRYKSSFIRRASFLGSVNDDKFLSDITGNRRWLVFKISSMDYLHDIDSDKVWAQAYSLWKEGYRHWFNLDEIKEINQINEEFRTMAVEEELLLKNFEFNEIDEEGEYLSSTEVIEKVIAAAPMFTTKMHSILMGKALSKHALNKKMSGGYTRYWVSYVGIIVVSQAEKTNDKQERPSAQIDITEGVDEDDDLPF